MLVNFPSTLQLVEERESPFTLLAQNVNFDGPGGPTNGPEVMQVSDDLLPGGGQRKVLQCNVQPTIAGSYTSMWTLVDSTNGYATRVVPFWASWTDVAGYVRQKLSGNITNIPNVAIDREFSIIDKYLRGQFGILPEYIDLLDDDRIFYDTAVSLFVALRLFGYTRKLAPIGEIIQWRVQENDFKFHPTIETGSVSVSKTWMDEATQMLGQVSVLKAMYAYRASHVKLFTISGPSRRSLNSGRRPTISSITAMLLSDTLDLAGVPLLPLA